MYLTDIKVQLVRAVELVEAYEQSGHSIDRDVALEIIRRAYEDLKFCGDEHLLVDDAVSPIVSTPTTEEPEVEVEIVMAEQDEPEVEEAAEENVEPESVESEQIVEEVAEEEPTVEDAPEPLVEAVVPEQTVEDVVKPVAVVEPEVETEVEVVVQSAPVVEVVVESEIEPEPEPEPSVEPEPKRVIVEPSLFGDDDIWSRPTPSRRRIRSLYGDDSTVEHKPRTRRKAAEPKVEPTVDSVAEPKVDVVADMEPPQVLADTISTPPVIADTIPAQPSVGESSEVQSLRGSISVGDRFMLIRELFGGDQTQYDSAIDTLDSFDNLDDCIIYIAENFTWRASSDGAKLVMELLQRKLS